MSDTDLKALMRFAPEETAKVANEVLAERISFRAEEFERVKCPHLRKTIGRIH